MMMSFISVCKTIMLFRVVCGCVIAKMKTRVNGLLDSIIVISTLKYDWKCVNLLTTDTAFRF